MPQPFLCWHGQSFAVLMTIQLLLTHSQGTEEIEQSLQSSYASQAALDLEAVSIGYNSDFLSKLQPGLFANEGSKSILEMSNNAEFSLSSAEATSSYHLAAYLCFMEPDTAGCNNFNDLGCFQANDCSSPNSKSNEMASLCSSSNDEGGKYHKSVDTKCFIISLRSSNNGAAKDAIAPWNYEVQAWIDSHNCTSLSYHLKYRCYSNLVKWDEVHARNMYVDMDSLFDSVFGLTSVAAFNDGNRLECSSLTNKDKNSLAEIAKMRMETAAINFVSIATTLARYGLSAADVTYPQKGMAPASMNNVQDKLRISLLLNLFYDGAVDPLKLVCCSLNVCYDYHPMDTFVDKATATNTFYPGGLASLTNKAEAFGGIQHINKEFAGHVLKADDAYVYNVLNSAPSKIAYEASTSTDVTDIESF